MPRKPLAAESKQLRRSLAVLFGFGFLLHGLSVWLARILGFEWHFPHLALHAGVEVAGAMLVPMVAYLLIRLDAIKQGSSSNLQIAAALLAMACLDGLHGVQAAGNTFVWLHSLATLLGGGLLALVWLPADRFGPRGGKTWPLACLALAALLGLLSLLAAEDLPRMLVDGQFSTLAVLLNRGGGLGMLLAALRLLWNYSRQGRSADLLFGLQCLLLGAAAVMFEQSSLWDLPWWTWHGLRLAAYLMALWLVFHSKSTAEQDISQEQAQQSGQLRRDNEALLAMINQQAIVSVTDRAGRITAANPAFSRISGYSEQELLGQNHRIVNSGVQSREFWAEMWATVAAGSAWRGEVCNRAKDGSLYWVDTLIAPFLDEAGGIEKYVSIRFDISTAVRAKAEARRNADLLSGAIDAVGGAFVLCDADDKVVMWNEKYRDLYPESAELLAQAGIDFETLTRHQARCGRFADARGREEDWVAARMAQHRRADSAFVVKMDNERWIRVIERRMSDGHIVGFRLDVSELMRATEAAEQGSRAKSQFLANMSHEIRTPMNAILGMLALLRRTELTARQADYAAKSEGAARSLLGILNDILDISKVEAGKMELDPRPFQIDALLREVAVILSGNADAKDLELLFDIDPDLPPQLLGDALRLRQVLINLTGNALKFTERGEVRLTLRVLQRSAQDVTLEFSVSDTGIGIAPENQARIFSGFTQAEASTTRRYGGTGLGVAISQRLVALMGGELKLLSTLGQGSRFYFSISLPLVVGESARDDSRQPQLVLMLDDNPAARELFQRMGHGLAWQVDQADSLAQALQHLGRRADAGERYDAIFVDWPMLGRQARQGLTQLRALAPAGSTSIIALLDAQGRELLLQAGEADLARLDGTLLKPLTASMLLDALMDARAGRQTKAGASSRARVGAAAEQSRPLAGVRLLLVEDNPNNQQVACEFLQEAGACVQVADNGSLAVEFLRAQPDAVDLVLMDIQMPVMDGYTATRLIRSELGLLDLPIVAMTANAMASDRADCLAAGMNEHVGKPFEIEPLLAVLLSQLRPGVVRAGAETGRADEVSSEVAAGKALSKGGAERVGAEAGGVDASSPPSRFKFATLAVPAALAQRAAAQGIELQPAMDRFMGKAALFQRMVRSFSVTALALPGQLESMLAEGQLAEAQMALHGIKGLAATLGAVDLAQLTGEGEGMLRRGAVPGSDWRQVLAGHIQAGTKELAHLADELLALSVAAQTAEAPAPGVSSAVTTPLANANPAGFAADLKALMGLLKDSDMGALDAFERLRERHAGQWPAAMDAVDSALVGLNFEQALGLLADVLTQLTEGRRG
ncbi:response regulator [Paucibacter sp. AS339]|uniref:hybrid sensor histidine kinase/response regulator n=1 Tax=Paucibacter hankyongi TaxID=3133434 RepID=UPI0030A0E5A1